MSLEQWVDTARQQGASDLHLEPGLPATLRIRGTLKSFGPPVEGKGLLDLAQALAGAEGWGRFLEQRSLDISRTIQGVRCRINVMQTSRGVGFAVRLLASFQATVERLNLHPDLKRFVAPTNGLVLVCGPTGSGKSSTLAALIQEVNLAEARHIVTIESPIEYFFQSRKSFIRQREVGRDTPGFERALLDALREDPDVLMVGEMREPETMRLTLNASETGHLVLATVHSATCAEALQRIVSTFNADLQHGVAAQLADCLVGVVSQRLIYRPDLKIRLPECEILTPSHAVKHFIRSKEFHKLISAMETGAEQGMWTFPRYRSWMERRTQWSIPEAVAESPDSEVGEPAVVPPPMATASPAHPAAKPSKGGVPKARNPGEGPIEIEPVEGGWERLFKEFKELE